MTIAELLNAKEGKNVEFKEAKNSYALLMRPITFHLWPIIRPVYAGVCISMRPV